MSDQPEANIAPEIKIAPAMREIILMLNELEQSSDRCVAIVGVAVVEDRLRQTIAAHLVDADGARDFLKDLTYSRVVDLAYALHIIGPETKSDLKTMGKIRNDFAHGLYIRDFEHKDVRTRVGQLTLWKRFKTEAPIGMQEKRIHADSSLRDKFQAAVYTVTIYLNRDTFDRAAMGTPTSP